MEVLIKGAEFLQKWADKKNKENLVAMEGAVRMTAAQIRKDMKNELRGGGLGLKAITRYQNKSRDPRYKRKSNTNPLNLLHIGLIYKFFKKGLRATIGFHGDTPKTTWARDWAGEHQTGTTINYGSVDSPMRKRLHEKGIHINPNTQMATVPMRDIIQNFFNRHQARVLDKLKTNLQRKLSGE